MIPDEPSDEEVKSMLDTIDATYLKLMRLVHIWRNHGTLHSVRSESQSDIRQHEGLPVNFYRRLGTYVEFSTNMGMVTVSLDNRLVSADPLVDCRGLPYE